MSISYIKYKTRSTFVIPGDRVQRFVSDITGAVAFQR